VYVRYVLENPAAEYDVKDFTLARRSIAWYHERGSEWEARVLQKEAPAVEGPKETPAGEKEGEVGVSDDAGGAVTELVVEAAVGTSGTSGAEDPVLVGKGKARAVSEGADDTKDSEDESDDDGPAVKPVRMRRAIAYDPHDPAIVKEVTLLPLSGLPKFVGPRPLRPVATKAEPVDGLALVSFFFFFRSVRIIRANPFLQLHNPACERCVERGLECRGPVGQSCGECRRQKARCAFAAPVGRGAPKVNAGGDEAGSSRRVRRGQTKKSAVVIEDSDEEGAPPLKRKRVAKGPVKREVESGSGVISVPRALKSVEELREAAALIQQAATQLAIMVSRLSDVVDQRQ
jgi:hypothetical protein